MNFIYLAFGTNIAYYQEAAFSIVSLLAKGKGKVSISVYTDAPQYFKQLSGAVTVNELSAEQQADWKGKYSYHYRGKIKVLEHVHKLIPNEPIVFIDTDTFFYADCTSFFAQATDGRVFMDREECVISKAKSSTVKKLWKRLGGKSFGGITVTERDTMWNSGVIVLPVEKRGEAITLALTICDEMLDDMAANGYYTHLLEQLAVSFALQKTYGQLQSASQYIGHYWGNKDGWHTAIDTFFSEAYIKAKSVDELAASADSFSYSSIPYYRRPHSLYHKLVLPFSKRCANRKAKYVK